ncbi:UbiA family prenyltransferase [Octadecabacter sp. SW4]|uniref:UbiA family prenyltransferase n=1 Tax=Octadecabacter sp. SW4 TaxID=2602067 RepID=UPI0011C20B86|nr:UbiA family prenyltransferase [Octadecabacter sp. SW4]QEE36374.1 UbiA family prenyltransferase [Octadecabacter sp. SW4]
MSDKLPLVLDVDGTFLKTDMLLESWWAGMGRDPMATLRASFGHFRDRAALKAELAQIAQIRTDLLPVNADVAAMAATAQDEGREVVLASASDASLVQPLADHYGMGGRIFASDGHVNLKGVAKADALVAAYGEGGFDYAGNDASDMAVWRHADTAIVVGGVSGTSKLTNVTKVSGGWAPRDLIRALRPHQWVKNVLLLLPMLAAHEFGLATLGLVLLGIAAFSAAASCIYIVNDLLDLEADRLHATKCRRPFASGAVPITVGMVACGALGVIALGLGALLGGAFLLVVVTYMILSLAYSLRLKRMRWIDIAVLATLYTLRVVAGAAASRVDASVFMLIFIFPVFITLGCVKRMTELALATDDERLPGRGYGRTDRGDLLNMAAIGMVGALVIFFLYSHSAQAQVLYPTKWLMWVALVPITGWLFRMIRLGYLGKQDYDPIVFALRDKRGIGLLLMTLALMFYSAGIWQQLFGF